MDPSQGLAIVQEFQTLHEQDKGDFSVPNLPLGRPRRPLDRLKWTTFVTILSKTKRLRGSSSSNNNNNNNKRRARTKQHPDPDDETDVRALLKYHQTSRHRMERVIRDEETEIAQKGECVHSWKKPSIPLPWRRIYYLVCVCVLVSARGCKYGMHGAYPNSDAILGPYTHILLLS
jgi:hypothetical protein